MSDTNIQEYIEALADNKIKGFAQAVSAQLLLAEQEIVSLKQAATVNDNVIESLNNQITTLNNTIDDLTTRLEEAIIRINELESL